MVVSPPYADSIAITDLTQGKTIYLAKQKFAGEASGYLRLTCDKAATLYFQFSPDGAWTAWPGGMTANITLVADDPVFAIKVVPTAAATLLIYATPYSYANREPEVMKVAMKKSGVGIE